MLLLLPFRDFNNFAIISITRKHLSFFATERTLQVQGSRAPTLAVLRAGAWSRGTGMSPAGSKQARCTGRATRVAQRALRAAARRQMHQQSSGALSGNDCPSLQTFLGLEVGALDVSQAPSWSPAAREMLIGTFKNPQTSSLTISMRAAL